MVNFCAGGGILLSVAAVVLFVFSEIGQLNSTLVPRHLRLVTITTNGLGASTGAGNAIYHQNNHASSARSSAPIHDGIYPTYEFGYWNYCAKIGGKGSKTAYCSERNFGYRIEPATVLYNDAPTQFEGQLLSTLPRNKFIDSKYFGRYTRDAAIISFVGAGLATLAMLVGLGAHRFAFLFGAFCAFFGFLISAVGAIMYTIVIHKLKTTVNDIRVNNQDLGIEAHYGNALWILWAGTAATLFSVVPYLIACITGRGGRKSDV